MHILNHIENNIRLKFQLEKCLAWNSGLIFQTESFDLLCSKDYKYDWILQNIVLFYLQTKVGAVDNTGVNGAVTNPVTGKKCGQDKLRKDVRDLSEREITGLRRAMNAIISSGMFGKLANYHGAPFTMCEPTGHHSWGCCPHDVDTFLPWHRLYLVNMEKVISWKSLFPAITKDSN